MSVLTSIPNILAKFLGEIDIKDKTDVNAVLTPTLHCSQAIVDKDTLEWPLANCALSLGGLEKHAHDSKTYIEQIKPATYETV